LGYERGDILAEIWRSPRTPSEHTIEHWWGKTRRGPGYSTGFWNYNHYWWITTYDLLILRERREDAHSDSSKSSPGDYHEENIKIVQDEDSHSLSTNLECSIVFTCVGISLRWSILDILILNFLGEVERILWKTNVVSSNTAHGEVYSIQHYVIKFVSDLRQVGGFLRVLRCSPTIKLTSTI
jgi:hypothetical protein